MKLTLINIRKKYKQKTHLPLSDFADTQDPPVQAVLSILAFFWPEEDDIVSRSVTVVLTEASSKEASVVSKVACVSDSIIDRFDVEVVLLMEVSLAVVGATVTPAESCWGKIIWG